MKRNLEICGKCESLTNRNYSLYGYDKDSKFVRCQEDRNKNSIELIYTEPPETFQEKEIPEDCIMKMEYLVLNQ